MITCEEDTPLLIMLLVWFRYLTDWWRHDTVIQIHALSFVMKFAAFVDSILKNSSFMTKMQQNEFFPPGYLLFSPQMVKLDH